MTSEHLTAILAERVMGWTVGPDRFMMGNRGWMPRWRFQPAEKLDDAFRLLEGGCATGVQHRRRRQRKCPRPGSNRMALRAKRGERPGHWSSLTRLRAPSALRLRTERHGSQRQCRLMQVSFWKRCSPASRMNCTFCSGRFRRSDLTGSRTSKARFSLPNRCASGISTSA